jgi:Xaa-Pro aminopeptidase
MLYYQKAAQAEALLAETNLDAWLIFARESVIRPDPGIELVVGVDVTWDSAFIFGRNGQRVALVGRYDVAGVRESGLFPTIIGYDESIRDHLIDVLRRLDPLTIGLNYSLDDPTADGLTHGMFLHLCDLLADTPFPSRFVSAAPLLAKLRSRKTPAEVERIRAAVAVTEEIVDLVAQQIRPGVSEAQIAAFVHEEFRRRNLASAWSWDACPIVNSGPESEVGHGGPRNDIVVQPGHLVHIDLGVQRDGYCSDIQRMWYVRRPGETAPPPDVQRAFETVVRAIEAGAAALRPGARGYAVDAAARQVIVAAGYDEYRHALGHGLGRACHDGGPLLGPRWPRYGKTPEMCVEAGNVYTLELGVVTAAGYIGIEEDVLVTDKGVEFLSTFQRRLWEV